MKAHTGNSGNKRADKLAKREASNNRKAADYNGLLIPICYIKRKLREEMIALVPAK